MTIDATKEVYEVKNQRIAGWLMQNGFTLIGLKEHDRGYGYLFYKSEALHNAMARRHKEIVENKAMYR